MNWIPYPKEKPQKSQSYTVSISRKRHNTEFSFTYVAYYDAEKDEWYKYDAFEDIEMKKDKITETVNGWVSDTGVYLGSFPK